MGRLLGIALILGATACAQTQEREGPAVGTSNTQERSQAEAMDEFSRRYGSCALSGTDSFVGAMPDEETIDQLLTLSGALVVRINEPGEPLSLEGNSGRLNIELDWDGTMRRFFCG